MLEPDWEQERPSDSEVKLMWRTIRFRPSNNSNVIIEDMVNRINNIMSNGGCIFKSYIISENSYFDWFASRNRLDEVDFFINFLTSEELVEDIPELNVEVDKENLNSFEWVNALTLDGELATLLIRGGAYECFKGTAQDAKELSMEFCKQLFQDRYVDIQIYKSYSPWSDWFYDVAWDGTWIILDKKERKIHLLCYTDTD